MHVSNNLGFSVYVRKYHVHQLVISRLPRYVYVSTYVPGWGTYYVPHMFVNWCKHVFCTWHKPAPKIRICRYVCTRDTKDTRPRTGSGSDTRTAQTIKSSTEKQGSAFIVHKPNRTATSTWTVHRRQNKPYRLVATSAGVVGTLSRCCPAATVRAAVVFACGFRCSFAD